MPRLMAVYAVKHGDESTDRLVNRFRSQWQDTRLPKILRERKSFKKKPSQRLQRGRALKREEYRQENRKKQYYSNM